MSMKINWYPVSAILLIILIWTLIIIGGCYIWKNYLGPRACKVITLIEVERSFYVR